MANKNIKRGLRKRMKINREDEIIKIAQAKKTLH